MRLPRLAGRKWNYSALAFLIPCVGMLTVMLFSQYKPFGNYSMLYSDMYHQYYPFFVNFRKALRSGDSLLYNWSIGMGMDYLGLIAYYLASPLNLLSVIVPEKWLLSYFSLLVPIKLGLAGLFFATFLKGIFQRDDFSVSVFGAFYGLCAWALGFQWNIMWLDSFALLPLVILGEIRLIRDRKYILYTASLFLAVFSNYYIGLFVCYFVALVFFCYEICRFPGWKRFFADLCHMALFSTLAIGMTLILTLPTVAALSQTQSSVNSFPKGFRMNIATENTIAGLLDAMRKVAGNMGGSLEPNFKEGLPNLYCGVGTLVLGMLYLISPDVKLRDKLCSVALLLFFALSFILRQLDYIWHGFHFPNMIPYRFSFLFSFVVLYMAYRAWVLRRNFRPAQLALAVVLTAAVLCCSEELLETKQWDFLGLTLHFPLYILYNLCFLILFSGALLYGMEFAPIPEDAEPEERRAMRVQQCRMRITSRCIALAVVCLEMIATLGCFAVYFPGTNVKNYPKGTESTASMVRYMNERERYGLFFRAEMTHAQSLNDDALIGYNGISAFTSSANVKVTEFMRTLGYGAKNTYNRYCFEESSPVANLLLDLKYMLDRDGRDRSGAFFEEVHHYNNVYLYKNTAYLPLGFLADEPLADVDFMGGSNVYALQNTIFSGATGLDPDVWHRIPDEMLLISGDGTEVTNVAGDSCKYGHTGGNATVNYAYTVDRDGFACIYLDFPKRNDFTIRINGVDVYSESISLPQMLAVGDVHAGEILTVSIQCPSGESGNLSCTAAILDDDLFRIGYERLAASTLELTSFRNTRVDGTIACNRDGLLYTSIPQNGNWSAYVDGLPAKIRLVGDCMIGLDLTEGQHSVSFRYHNVAFALGWKLSVACAAVFAGLMYYDRFQESKKKKTEET